jgi:hypothetical protein
MKLPLSLMLILVGTLVQGQIPLTESMRAALDVSQALELSPTLSQKLLTVALPADACLAHWTAMRDSLEQSSISEEDLLVEVLTIQEAMKACRQSRRDNMRQALPESYHQAFDQFSDPAKPAVLHFGLHNRMDCNVCKPQ